MVYDMELDTKVDIQVDVMVFDVLNFKVSK